MEGEVEISKRLLLPLWETENTHQEKSLIHLSEKDFPFFGEMTLFEENPERSASIFAVQDCTLAVLHKQDMLNILDKHPKIGSTIYKNIAKELTFRLIKANHDILKLTTAFCLALEGE
jgi:CRP/FNR family cyclic AMP-dependent transcriptional regulator